MTRGTGERSPAVLRVLADAERAAWAGDLLRARRLLRLAERLAPADGRSDVLVAAESVRSAAGADRRPQSPLPHQGAPLDSLGLPRLRPLQEHAGFGRVPPLPVTGSPTFGASQATGQARRRARPPRRMLAAVAATLLVAGFCLGGRLRVARFAADVGQPGLAVHVLGNVRSAEELLVRGDARLARRDSIGAVTDFVGAAHAADARGASAWNAGERLERMVGQHDATADAYLQAYVLGIQRGRWERVAGALERVGRRDEAQRVRAGVGR